MRDRPALDLFLVSWLVLFLELACIRWFPAHVLFLSFFTNTVLLACFVGMSIGCLTARQKTHWIRSTPLVLAIALASGLTMDLFSQKLSHRLSASDQSAKGEVVFFGSEINAAEQKDYYVPVELVAAVFFGLIATVMVGPGQEMGRAFNRVANRSTAYSVNLLGSLVGILCFAGFSLLELPPLVWFLIAAVGVAFFALRKQTGESVRPEAKMTLGFLALAVILTLPTSGVGLEISKEEMITRWSPYYRLDLYPASGTVLTNRVSHQVMVSRNEALLAGYALPFLFARDVPKSDPKHEAWPPFQRVLIIGAGSGNDLSRALQWCDSNARIDVVEIDPAIQKIGAERHPDEPYRDPRVKDHIHINDGRNFLRTSPPGEYDLVVFALIDSLILHSAHSNVRLENFLFTVEAFQDVKRVLKPSGLFAVYNFFRQGWLVARLRDMLKKVYGTDPVVLTAPPKDRIELDVPDYHAFTALFAGSDSTLEPLKRAFDAADNSYWLAFKRPVGKDTPNGFQKDQPKDDLPPLPKEQLRDDVKNLKENWGRLRKATVQDSGDSLPLATDDWPFLYIRKPTIPGHTWNGMGLVVLMSAGLWMFFKRRSLEPGNAEGATFASTSAGEYGLFARSFFLGAGFMLVETKAVVHMALLFGSTWMVNTVVFAAVLMMALAGNLLAARLNPRSVVVFYAGLFAALAAGILIPLGAFLGLDRGTQILGACALVFAPIAFAGVVFAASFRRTTQPDRMFGANVAGALVGGLAENTSMLLGFQMLLCVAVVFYALSALCGNRSTASRAA